jgi:uncharacterized membrane-anchored protein
MHHNDALTAEVVREGKAKIPHVKPTCGAPGISAQAVGARAEEFEEAEVAEDLELLADFVADVSVVGMEFG